MTFSDHLHITTSEGVSVSLTIAGMGSRALAWLLDGLVIAFAWFLLGVGSALLVDFDSLLAVGLVSLVATAIPLAYLVGFEVLNGGRTPGKMAAGTKVIRASGAPVGVGAAMVRALLIPIDFFVMGAGIITMLSTARSQRLGDLAAKTVVVRARSPQTPGVVQTPTPTPEGPAWDVSAVTAEEIGAIRTFLQRAYSLPVDRRRELGVQLMVRIAGRVTGNPPGLHPEEFLQRVVAYKSAG